MKKGLLLINFLLFTVFAIAQDTGTLKGIIKDKSNGLTIPGSSVVLESDKGRGAATNLDGEYQLILPAGNHKVIVSSMSYASQTLDVVIKAGETTTLNIDMEVESEQLEMVVVSAGKFEQRVEDLTVSVSVIQPQMVENRASTTAEEALEQTPGLTIMDSEPQMRGGSGYSFGAGARVMLLVDDLPILSGDAGRPSWGFIPVENLEQIEVIKGASSVLYGSAALNGIINVRTAFPKDKPKTKINLFTGFYSKPEPEEARWWGEDDLPIFTGLNFFHSRKAKNWDIVIGGNFLIDNGYIGYEPHDTIFNEEAFILDSDEPYGLDGNGAVIRDENGNPTIVNGRRPSKEFENRFRINTNIRKRSGKNSGLAYGLNLNFMYNKSAGSLLWLNSTNGIYRPFGGAITKTIQTSANVDPYFTYSGIKGAKHTLRGRVFYQNNDNDNNQGNLNTVSFGEYQFAKRFDKIKDFIITVGAMGQYTISEAELYAGNENGDGNNSATNAALYLQFDKKFWNRLNVNGGVRAEYFSVNGRDTIIRPVFRLGVSSELWREGYLRGSFGEGFRFPTIAERYISTTVGGLPIVPNPEIQPERSFAGEIGIKQGIKIGKFLGYLDVAGFWQEYQNFVEFNAGKYGDIDNGYFGLAFRSVNTGPAMVRGVDASLMGNGQFTPWFGMNVLVGYTYARPESKTPQQVYDYDNDSIPLTQLNTSSSLFPINGETPTAADTAAFLAYPVLKYRFEHLINADIEFVFKVKKKYAVAFGVTYRYYSYMKSVDKIFYNIDPLFNWGATEFRETYNKGDHVFDIRGSVELTEQVKVAMVVTNLFNRVYALRPLKVNAPRTATIQLTVQF